MSSRSNELLERALLVKRSRDLTFLACYPHPQFPTISVTGAACSLKCKHCAGQYLKRMISCTTPEVFHSECLRLAQNGARGVLLSGGYNRDGYVPFEPFLDAIERVKRETGLFISAHTGLVPEALARELGRVGVNSADFDLIGDNETIRLVVGIEREVEDYRRALLTLKAVLPHVVPHICVGLHAGELRGELRALEIASEVRPPVLVLLAFTPTSGTAFGDVDPPSPEDMARIMAEARLKFPNAQLALGCMRPRGEGRPELELAALRSGVDRIEMPTQRTIDEAVKLGLHVKRLDACCSVPPDSVLMGA